MYREGARPRAEVSMVAVINWVGWALIFMFLLGLLATSVVALVRIASGSDTKIFEDQQKNKS